MDLYNERMNIRDLDGKAYEFGNKVSVAVSSRSAAGF